MSNLERLDEFFGSDKSKQTLLRTQQAYRIAGLVEERSGVPVRVVIRDSAVILEVTSSAAATKLMLSQEAVEKEVAAVVGGAKQVKIKVKRTGRLE
jgi:hypothetical protein